MCVLFVLCFVRFVCLFVFFFKEKETMRIVLFFLVNSSLFSYSANVYLRQESCKKKDACMCPKEMDIGLPLVLWFCCKQEHKCLAPRRT